MTPRLSHIAIACPQLSIIAKRLETLSLRVAETHHVPTEKVTAAMIPIGVSEHLRIELLEPTAQDSPIAKFLEKRPAGGLHHLCFEVADLEHWLETLRTEGIEI